MNILSELKKTKLIVKDLLVWETGKQPETQDDAIDSLKRSVNKLSTNTIAEEKQVNAKDVSFVSSFIEFAEKKVSSAIDFIYALLLSFDEKFKSITDALNQLQSEIIKSVSFKRTDINFWPESVKTFQSAIEYLTSLIPLTAYQLKYIANDLIFYGKEVTNVGDVLDAFKQKIIALGIITHQHSLTDTEVKALASGHELIAAQGELQLIECFAVYCKLNWVAGNTAYTVGEASNLQFYFDDGLGGLTPILTMETAGWLDQSAESYSKLYKADYSQGIAIKPNQKLMCKMLDADVTLGDSDIEIVFEYKNRRLI